MNIVVNLDVMLARRKMKLKELAKRIDLSVTNLSLLKTGKAKGVRFNTLGAICEVLECQPGDILEYRPRQNKAAPPNTGPSGQELTYVG